MCCPGTVSLWWRCGWRSSTWWRAGRQALPLHGVYRTKEEVEEHKLRDPISSFAEYLTDKGVLDNDELARLQRPFRVRCMSIGNNRVLAHDVGGLHPPAHHLVKRRDLR